MLLRVWAAQMKFVSAAASQGAAPASRPGRHNLTRLDYEAPWPKVLADTPLACLVDCCRSGVDKNGEYLVMRKAWHFRLETPFLCTLRAKTGTYSAWQHDQVIGTAASSVPIPLISDARVRLARHLIRLAVVTNGFLSLIHI